MLNTAATTLKSNSTMFDSFDYLQHSWFRWKFPGCHICDACPFNRGKLLRRLAEISLNADFLDSDSSEASVGAHLITLE